MRDGDFSTMPAVSGVEERALPTSAVSAVESGEEHSVPYTESEKKPCEAFALITSGHSVKNIGQDGIPYSLKFRELAKVHSKTNFRDNIFMVECAYPHIMIA